MFGSIVAVSRIEEGRGRKGEREGGGEGEERRRYMRDRVSES